MKIKTLRKSLKLTQQDVADALGISKRAYAAYEKDNVRPRHRETYQKLAKVLACDVNYLLIEDDLYGGEIGETPSTKREFASTGAGAWKLFRSLFQTLKAQYEVDEAEDPKGNYLYQKAYQDRQRKFQALAFGLIVNRMVSAGIQIRPGETNDARFKNVPDECLLLEGSKIKEWWFSFFAKDAAWEEMGAENDEIARSLISRFLVVPSDSSRKISIVVDDLGLFEELCSFKGENAYRGLLSVILVNQEEARIVREVIIATFDGKWDQDEPDGNGYILSDLIEASPHSRNDNKGEKFISLAEECEKEQKGVRGFAEICATERKKLISNGLAWVVIVMVIMLVIVCERNWWGVDSYGFAGVVKSDPVSGERLVLTENGWITETAYQIDTAERELWFEILDPKYLLLAAGMLSLALFRDSRELIWKKQQTQFFVRYGMFLLVLVGFSIIEIGIRTIVSNKLLVTVNPRVIINGVFLHCLISAIFGAVMVPATVIFHNRAWSIFTNVLLGLLLAKILTPALFLAYGGQPGMRMAFAGELNKGVLFYAMAVVGSVCLCCGRRRKYRTSIR